MNAPGRIELMDEPGDVMTLEQIYAHPRAAMPLAVQQPQSPMALMLQAGAQGTSLETLERMWALQVQYEEREAEKAMVDAMAAFKKNPPRILKDKHVTYANKSGGTTDYMHATHYGVTSAIIACLAEHGISHRWVTDQQNGMVGVTCVLTHKLGHSESVRLEAAPDQSGGKNSIQAVISAKTYLERHTLLAATGLSTADMAQEDDDGRGAGTADDKAFDIRDAWVERLNAALNQAVLNRTWKMALEEVQPLNRMDVYGAVREAMAAKTKALAGAAA